MRHRGRRGCRITAALIAAVMTVGTIAGCSGTQENETGQSDGQETPGTQEMSSTQETTEYVPKVAGVYEAEDGSFTGNVKSDTAKPGYSGTGYASGFADNKDACSISIDISEEGFYDLVFTTASNGGYKENYVTVDGESVGNLVSEDSSFTDTKINRVYLTAGTHQVTVEKYWGWICLDKLTVQTSQPIDPAIYEVSGKLVNPNASESARRLMSYLTDSYGKNILSGQYCDTGQFGKEFAVVNKVTGKYPAVLGLDFIEYSPSRAENGSTSKATEYAKTFWENGGIVTFCWHWNAPSKYLTGEWWSGFRTESTNINLAKIMNGEDEEGYELLMQDIDAIAQQLLILQEADVPILWRPLHEASGGWFWWGASGPEAYKKLYILLYDKLTNEYGLNNLIWLWNGQDAEWYPGDEYVDIIGEDLYPGEHVYTSQVNKFLEAVDYTSGKMVVMSENGCVFDPELAKRDGAMWGFFCTWGVEFVAKNTSIYAYSEQYTEENMLKAAYDSEIVITLDELPDLKNYPLKE